MFEKEDKTFNILIENSVNDWLNQMEQSDDIVARGGVKATREYIAILKREINALKEKNELKDQYLKKLKTSKRG